MDKIFNCTSYGIYRIKELEKIFNIENIDNIKDFATLDLSSFNKTNKGISEQAILFSEIKRSVLYPWVFQDENSEKEHILKELSLFYICAEAFLLIQKNFYKNNDVLNEYHQKLRLRGSSFFENKTRYLKRSIKDALTDIKKYEKPGFAKDNIIKLKNKIEEISSQMALKRKPLPPEITKQYLPSSCDLLTLCSLLCYIVGTAEISLLEQLARNKKSLIEKKYFGFLVFTYLYLQNIHWAKTIVAKSSMYRALIAVMSSNSSLSCTALDFIYNQQEIDLLAAIGCEEYSHDKKLKTKLMFLKNPDTVKLFGQRVKQFREGAYISASMNSFLTQQEFAEWIGVHRSALNKIEKAHNKQVSVEFLKLLHKKTGLLSFFLTNDVAMEFFSPTGLVIGYHKRIPGKNYYKS